MNRSRKISYIVLIALAATAFMVVLVRASYNSTFIATHVTDPIISVFHPAPAPDDTSAQQQADLLKPQVKPATGTPLSKPRLIIPSINVSAYIEDVGVTPTGEMATPDRLADVGWYKFGTPIGDLGSAVIAGHVDDSLALPAVFFNLKKVKIGDDIYVTPATGPQLHFVVTDVADYALATAPVDEIFNDKSGHLLRLITCEGILSEGQFAYNHRIVVTAKLM